MEKLGEEGKVDASQQLLSVVNSLREKKSLLESEANRPRVGSDVSQTQTVCEVCGAILVKNDAETRVASHLEGKMHQGFKRTREKIEELIGKGIRPSRGGGGRRRERERERSRERGGRRSRERSRERGYRNRYRDRRSRSRR